VLTGLPSYRGSAAMLEVEAEPPGVS